MSTPPFMNLTLRAARWSAAHPWRAVLGWLAFVLAAFAIVVSSQVGRVYMPVSMVAMIALIVYRRREYRTGAASHA